MLPTMPSTVNITTEPSGAKIYIDDLYFGETPAENFFDSGTYPIHIEKQNYDTIDEMITITDPETSSHYKLEDIRATLTIRTDPSATVIFNEQEYPGGLADKILLPQTISFRIDQEYCETIEETCTLQKGENRVFELYPEDISANLTIKTYPDATVKFNGKSIKGGISNYKIIPQVLTIQIEQQKADPIKRIINLQPKSTKVIEIYPKLKTGTIQIAVIPNTSKIELKGDAGEEFTAIGRNNFTDIPIGSYTLRVTNEKYISYEETITIIKDDSIRRSIKLEKSKYIKSDIVILDTLEINSRTIIVECQKGDWEYSIIGENPLFSGLRSVDALNLFVKAEIISQEIADSIYLCNRIGDSCAHFYVFEKENNIRFDAFLEGGTLNNKMVLHSGNITINIEYFINYDIKKHEKRELYAKGYTTIFKDTTYELIRIANGFANRKQDDNYAIRIYNTK